MRKVRWIGSGVFDLFSFDYLGRDLPSVRKLKYKQRVDLAAADITRQAFKMTGDQIKRTQRQ
jgi:hypothetical protein